VAGKGIPLLVLGASGVGKEMFARALHASSTRAARPFVAVNCAALPEHLIEAELFGYVPGAFTGAARGGSVGRLREAHGGTLFLDEIGDMPLALQTRLLRVLQDRQVIPLGSGTAHPVDFELVCATHCDLRAAVAAGRFRADLYYRINGLAVQLPALRERSDFEALTQRLLDELALDWEALLAEQVGEVAARQIGRAVSSGVVFLRALGEAFRRYFPAWLQDEQAVVPSAEEVETFTRQSMSLGSDVDRLAARISRLQGRRS